MTNWISVSEQLPAEYEDVLVYVKMKDKDDDRCNVAYRRGAKFYLSSYLALVGEITHWMPLPESPVRKKK